MEYPRYDDENGTCRNMLPDDATCGLTGTLCKYKGEYAVLGYVDDADRPNAEVFAFCDSLEEARTILEKIRKYDGARVTEESARILADLSENHGVAIVTTELGEDFGFQPEVDARIVIITHVTR
jgi:hypothetical protein